MADELHSAALAPRVLLAGGGSGGHVFPALAIGDELARRGWRMSFAGNPDGMEHELATAHGLEFVPLAARPLVGRSPVARLRAAVTLASSASSARRWLRAHDAAAVVGTGGYASAPAVVGAAWARRPAVLVEPNARAGLANRWLSRLASAAAVAWPETGCELRCPSRVTGVPVRSEFFAVEPLAADAPRRLLVLGGSQGAQSLNAIVPAAIGTLIARWPDLEVVHQCGDRNLDATRALWHRGGVSTARVQVVGFVADVAAALSRSTLVVSRAGAITLAEICAAGRPSLLAPLDLASGHQHANARRLVAAGAAGLLEDGADSVTLAGALEQLLADGSALAAMGTAARALARRGAAAAIADEVERLARVAA